MSKTKERQESLGLHGAPEGLAKIVGDAEEKYGALFCLEKDGVKVKSLNCFGAAAIFKEARGLIYNSADHQVYCKDLATGVWMALPEDELYGMVNAFWLDYFQSLSLQFGFIARSSLAKEIVRALKGISAEEDFFSQKPGEYVVHCKNGILRRTRDSSWELLPLDSAEIHSRFQINADYDPTKDAPRVMVLLEKALKPDDIRVFQDYAGQVLLGRNLSQTFLIVTGEAGSGKTTAVNILEKVLGENNATELRTGAMNGLFELGRYSQHSLLVGHDVPSDFLKERGAERLKALTAGDRLTIERKHSNEVGAFRGALNVIIVSNSHQPIRLSGDRDAWERRVRSITFHKPEGGFEPIRDYDTILATEEASGILNFALQGLDRIIDNDGVLQIGDEQKKQIADLLDESEAVQVFVRNCLEKPQVLSPEAAKMAGITTMEAYNAFVAYCAKRGWTPMTFSKFAKEVPDAMARSFGVEVSTSIPRKDGNKRGYRGVFCKEYTAS